VTPTLANDVVVDREMLSSLGARDAVNLERPIGDALLLSAPRTGVHN
jgi:hypothetical protein